MQSQSLRSHPLHHCLKVGLQVVQISSYFMPLLRAVPHVLQLFSLVSSFLQQSAFLQVLASPVQPLEEQLESEPQHPEARIMSVVIHTSFVDL